MFPKNGIYIIQGEVNHVVAALRRSNRWSGGQFQQDDDNDPLLNSFAVLKDSLQDATDFSELDTNIFLGPFLEVIRSEDTTGPITGVALSSVNKFLSYGLLDPTSESASSGIDNLADAVNHARFVGTDPSSDEVVLMKILQVLRTLLLSPVGVHMTNEAVCEIMQSCFRICFEMRLTELLRRSAEQTLIDMVQLLFLRLPQFKDDIRNSLSSPHIRKLFKRSGHSIAGRKSKKSRTRSKPRTDDVPHAPLPTEVKHSHSDSEMATSGADSTSKTKPMLEVNPTSSDDLDLSNRKKLQKFKPLSAEDAKGADNTELGGVDPDIMKSIDDISEACDVSSKCQTESETESVKESGSVKKGSKSEKGLDNFVDHGVISLHYPEEDTASVDSICLDDTSNKETKPASEVENKEDYVNSQGIRFTPQENNKEGQNTLTPYGLPCVHELLRYLTSLINPGDRHNTNTMIHIGLSLITVALESGAPHLSHFPSLLQLVKNDLCRNLFTLLQCDIHLLFSLSMRVCFLLFEALRPNLKYQNERFFVKMMDILSVDNLNVPYEKREMALEYINQLFHIPGLVQELYVNFDCDLHCSNVLEDLCKILSKNAFRPGSLASVNHLSLEALLTITNEIESQCLSKRKKTNERTISCSSSEVTVDYESGSEETHNITHTALSTSGYAAGQRFLGMGLGGINEIKTTANDNNKLANINEVTERVPTKEEIVNKKLRKKLLTQGIEEFNKKPKAGIEFMQEHNLLSTPYNPEELVAYLKENPRVDKKTVGEFIGARKNPESLKAFVGSFSMKNVRIDEALRDFLESFRLPGEAPVISLILEEFTSIYFEKNLTPYKNNDAAFTLAYAVIMLNVDQHNKNVKQQKSMSVDDFKRNLRKTNGDEDFPPELLEEIFENIRTNEIVMPSERVGKVKDAYEWKVLLQKCNSASAAYTQVSSSLYDEELFLVVWGPTVAALSYVYENANDKAHIQKTLAGFKKCAVISAHYNLSEVFDNLLISLCKFTKLLVTGETSDNLPILFGNNLKAQLSMRTVFTLTHKQGDILREGWQNLLVCLTQLLKGKILPTELTEVEDFVEQSGKVSLIKEEVQPAQKQDTSGVFATFYSYMVANPDVQKGAALTVEDKQAQETAVNCIKECHPENIITESKFLRPESLQELIKALVIASKPEHSYESTDVPYDEDGAVFFLEFLIRVALQNRDRISLLWQALREHLSNIIIGAPKVSFLVERAVVGLLRLSIRLLRRDDISGQVLITLRILLMMHPKVLLSCSKQISYGLHELIRTNAPNLHYSRDWITVLTILQVVGAGASPPIVKPGVSLTLISGDSGGAHVHEEPQVDTETGETLSAEHMHRGEDEVQQHTPPLKANNSEQWLLINKNEDDGIPVNQYELKFKEKLNKHDCRVFIKTSSSVNFIVQEMAHVNEANIFQCIYAVLLFGEACRDGGMKYKLEDTVMHEIENEMQSQRQQAAKTKANSGKSSGKGKRAVSPGKRSTTDTPSPRDDDEQFNESTGNIYDAISLQLLDLMYALHTKASGILGSMSWSNYQDKQQAELKARWSSKESIDQLPSTFRGDVDEEMLLLWVKCWCPLLQGIARLCCDSRRDIRMSALTVLQRSMLAEDLQSLTATEWENCFNQVLFPMLASLLELSADVDPLGLEETRMRAATLLCKAFLQHLNTLITLSTFTALWMTILDFMDKYMHADNSELLYEAIPESLKNMLLVMSTAGIFEHCLQQEGSAQPHLLNTDSNLRRYSALWQVTWDRIDCFLPNLKSDLMATRSPVSLRASSPPEPDEPQTMTIHTEQDIHTPHQHPAPQEETAVAGEPATNQQTAGTAPVSAPASPTVLPQTFNSPPLATTPPSANAAQRAASPLLSNEITAGLNVQLFTPLPILSPPGSAHAIQRGDIPTPLAGNTPSPPGAHPVPVLLPAMPLLTTPASPEKSSKAEQCQGEETSQEKEENSGKSSVFDI